MNLGAFLLFAACGTSALAAILSGAGLGRPHLGKKAGVFWLCSCLALTAATAVLLRHQVCGDFSFSYATQHTSRSLPLVYRISALWAGQEGSMLLWALIGAWFGWPFHRRARRLDLPPAVFACYALLQAGLVLLAAAGHPFARLAAVPADGYGLNQALQNPWMVVHPPLVFCGYTAMAILCCHGLAAWPAGADAWLASVRRWILASLLLLGAGLLTGSLWAYQALGWGGFWSWDPIENAALIPWLLLAAAAHRSSVDSTVTAGDRAGWIAPFVLAVFGAFLARSGVLGDRSLHAYAGSPLGYPLLLLGLGLVAVVLILIGKSRRAAGRRAPWTSGRILRWLFFCYACLIGAGTLMPVADTNAQQLYFNTVSTGFAVLGSVWFMLAGPFRALGAVKPVLISAIVVAGLALGAGLTGLGWLILLWVYLLPPVALLIRPRTFGKITGQGLFRLLPHLGLFLLIIGATCSTAFSRRGAIVPETVGNRLVIRGSSINRDLTNGQSVIVRRWDGDLVVAPVGSAGASLVQYTTRPLIGLFWLGGLLILGGTLFVWITIKPPASTDKTDRD